MKRLSIVLVAWVLAGCAALIGPREVEVPQARLQQSLERRFPFSQRYLGMFDVSAGDPQVTLLPGQNRISTAMVLSVRPLIGGGVRGRLTVSGVPRVDAARGTLVLAEPRVDALELDGLERGAGSQLAGVASLLAQTLIGELPVYRFEPEALRHAGVRFVPVEIITRSDRLVVTFAPVK